MAIERYGSKTDVVVKLVLVFFVCLLSFSVGTFVGKTFSDNQHRLAQFEPASTEREVASTTEATPKSGDALSDDEIAKLAEEFVNEDDGHAVAKNDSAAPTASHGAPQPANTETAKAEAHAAPAKTETAKVDAHAAPAHVAPARNVAEAKPAAPAAAHAAPAAPAAKPQPTAEKLAQGHSADHHAKPAPAAKTPASTETQPSAAKVTLKPDTEKKPVPSSLPEDVAASAIGKFTVQVASYPTEAEATKMTENLKGQGFGAFYVKADITDKKTAATKTWFRVSVGLFQSQKEADAYKADLLSRSKVSSAIVQKITK